MKPFTQLAWHEWNGSGIRADIVVPNVVTWFSNDSNLHMLYTTLLPITCVDLLCRPDPPTTLGGESCTSKTIRMDKLIYLVHSMTRRHAPGSVKVHLKYGRLTLKDVKDACDALDGTPLKSNWAQVSSQQLKAASKKINAELERRAKRAKWQANVSKQVMSTIWPKNYLLNIWFPSWAVTEHHLVSNLIITGVQAIVDQEVCFSPICLLSCSFWPFAFLT